MENTKIKYIIFLDIDGVFNHQQFYTARHEKILAGIKIPKLIRDLDPVAIGYINGMFEYVPKEQFGFVCSSTWRSGHTLEELNEKFAAAGAQFEFISKTPSYLTAPRGHEVREWLDNKMPELIGLRSIELPDYFCIDDDDYDYLICQIPHMYKIDSFVGLTPSTTNAIIQKITGESFPEKLK